eukprot:GHVN01100312.1.p1 GENE.GHVN01100312.1~~GHVN01100312.1.p1  ORF type:complete len:157 (-),score=64.72 GHVN01100312.1:181-651(-)
MIKALYRDLSTKIPPHSDKATKWIPSPPPLCIQTKQSSSSSPLPTSLATTSSKTTSLTSLSKTKQCPPGGPLQGLNADSGVDGWDELSDVSDVSENDECDTGVSRERVKDVSEVKNVSEVGEVSLKEEPIVVEQASSTDKRDWALVRYLRDFLLVE